MKIVSSAFENNAKIPAKYTCDGENINPPLSFFDVPRDAKSLVLIMDDPDAPSKTWVHWVVYNIDPKTKEILENSVPKGAVLGITDFGKPGYGGPCPPSGVHRYFFKLYALDSLLDLPQESTKTQIGEVMQGHIIDKTQLIGLYGESD
ncbi:MAG: YbhB/YbcL family Raf kinase inhibitor-like protein [Candidatus Levybacteria bacterium]|nr:YbhB/YbcL family Raf kinase inhibitor-like protein [Candidatus Levybacteria bacterium]